MSIRRYITLYDDTAADTSDWIALDTRHEDTPQSRSLIISLTAGDEITIEGTLKDEKGIDKTFLDTLTADEIVTLKIYTESEADILDGHWTYIRVTKTGTAGAAKVTGFI